MIKLVPNHVHTLEGGAKSLVHATKTYPPYQHPSYCPLGGHYTVLELQTNFGSRWFGVKRAWIGSDLNMHVEPLDDRFEEMAAWADAPPDRCSFWTESLSDPMCDKCDACIEQNRASWNLLDNDAHPFNDQYYIVLGNRIGDQWVLLRYWRMLKTWSVYEVKVNRIEDPTGCLNA